MSNAFRKTSSLMHKKTVLMRPSNFDITILLDNATEIEIGYTLDTNELIKLETWTAEQEEAERIQVFSLLGWFPIRDFDCEYCGATTPIGSSSFQFGFSYDPDDYDRIRILCEKCLED